MTGNYNIDLGWTEKINGESPVNADDFNDVFERIKETAEQCAEAITHINEVAESVRNDADNGEFDGKPGEQGPRGFSGLVPQVELEYSANIILAANTESVISELTGNIELTVGEGEEGYSNEWDFIITQGQTAYTVVLPEILWGELDISPTFSAGTSTICRLYYLGETLCGEWVSV